MKFYYITFRSVTYAQRGERLMKDEGVHCSIQRTPRWMESQGCGYALRIWCEDIVSVVNVLQKNRVPMRKIYRQGRDGQLEELTV